MNEETIKIIQLNRKKQRILGQLISAFDGSLTDGEEQINEVAAELTELQREAFGYNEPTVKDVIHKIHQLTECKFGNDVTVGELQDLIFQQVDLLASLLGIELEDEPYEK